MLQVNAIPKQPEISAFTYESRDSIQNSPVSITSGDTSAKSTGEVEPKALPELAGNGGDGHGGVVDEEEVDGGCGCGR